MSTYTALYNLPPKGNIRVKATCGWRRNRALRVLHQG